VGVIEYIEIINKLYIFLPCTKLFGGVFLRSENFLFSVPGKKPVLLLEYDGVHWGNV
jgi:hypothetical protein